MTRILIALTALLALALPAGALTRDEIRQCEVMAATFEARTAKIEEARAARDLLAEQVEAAGAAWEDVEVHRNISARHAASADRAKADWEAAKAELARAEMALQADVRQLNGDMAQYNAKCAAEGG